jgi:hypothetical protein
MKHIRDALNVKKKGSSGNMLGQIRDPRKNGL